MTEHDPNEGKPFDEILQDISKHSMEALGRHIPVEKLQRMYGDLKSQYECNEVSEEEVYEQICSDTDRGLDRRVT